MSQSGTDINLSSAAITRDFALGTTAQASTSSGSKPDIGPDRTISVVIGKKGLFTHKSKRPSENYEVRDIQFGNRVTRRLMQSAAASDPKKGMRDEITRLWDRDLSEEATDDDLRRVAETGVTEILRSYFVDRGTFQVKVTEHKGLRDAVLGSLGLKSDKSK